MAGPILLVHDDIATIAVIRRLLAKDGHEVVLATSAADAVIGFGHHLPSLMILAPAVEGGRGSVALEEIQQHPDAGLLRVLLLGETLPGFSAPVIPLPLDGAMFLEMVQDAGMNVSASQEPENWTAVEHASAGQLPVETSASSEEAPESWRVRKPASVVEEETQRVALDVTEEKAAADLEAALEETYRQVEAEAQADIEDTLRHPTGDDAEMEALEREVRAEAERRRRMRQAAVPPVEVREAPPAEVGSTEGAFADLDAEMIEPGNRTLAERLAKSEGTELQEPTGPYGTVMEPGEEQTQVVEMPQHGFEMQAPDWGAEAHAAEEEQRLAAEAEQAKLDDRRAKQRRGSRPAPPNLRSASTLSVSDADFHPDIDVEEEVQSDPNIIISEEGFEPPPSPQLAPLAAMDDLFTHRALSSNTGNGTLASAREALIALAAENEKPVTRGDSRTLEENEREVAVAVAAATGSAQREDAAKLAAAHAEELARKAKRQVDVAAQALERELASVRESSARQVHEAEEAVSRERERRSRLEEELERLRRASEEAKSAAAAAAASVQAERANRQAAERALTEATRQAEAARVEAERLAAAALLPLDAPGRTAAKIAATGSVDLRGLARVVLSIVQTGAEVKLEVRSNEALRVLWFHRGSVVGACSSVAHESLLDRARRDGLIDSDQESELRLIRAAASAELLRVLRARSYIRDAEVVPLVQRHTEQIALEALSEPECIYRIAREQVPAAEATAAAPRSGFQLLF
ncbi:MAG: hypothetical protein ACT4TC_12605, partial [Myxococcaceae bacterium]